MSRGEGWLQGKKPHWGSRALQGPAKDGEEEESCPLQKPEPQERAQRFPSRQPAPRVAGGRCARCRDPWLVPRALSYERLCTQADLCPWPARGSEGPDASGARGHHALETLPTISRRLLRAGQLSKETVFVTGGLLEEVISSLYLDF